MLLWLVLDLSEAGCPAYCARHVRRWVSVGVGGGGGVGRGGGSETWDYSQRYAFTSRMNCIQMGCGVGHLDV